MSSKRKPLALVYSDLHINLWPKFNEDNRRLDNAFDVIELINRRADQLGVPKLFLGDLLHKGEGMSNELLSLVLPRLSYQFSDSFKQKTYAITGNHDQSHQNSFEKQSPSYIDTFSKAFKNLECIDFELIKIDNILFYGVPYLTNDTGLIDHIKKVGKDNRNKKIVLLLHTTLPSARDTDGREIHSHLGGNEFLKATKHFDLVLSGHIHKPEMVVTNFMYSIGAPQQQRATDRNCDMGYWVLYNNLEMEFIHLDKYPRFIYYTKDKKDDGNFWVRKPQKVNRKSKAKSIKLVRNITSHDPNKVAKGYCKSKNIADKRKVMALRKVLKEVI